MFSYNDADVPVLQAANTGGEDPAAHEAAQDRINANNVFGKNELFFLIWLFLL